MYCFETPALKASPVRFMPLLSILRASIAAMLLMPALLHAQCPVVTALTEDCTTGCTYTITADAPNHNYNVNSGEKLCVASGVSVTGNWNVNISPGASVVNCGSIDVGNISVNNGVFYNYGSVTTNNLNSGAGAALMNYGDWEIANGFNLNAGFEIYNEGFFEVGGDFNVNNGGFQNAGDVYINGTWRQNNGDVCLQPGSEIIADDLQMNNGTIGGSGGCMNFASGTSIVQGSGSVSGTIDLCDDGGAVSTSGGGTIASTVTTCASTGCDAVLPIVFSSVELLASEDRFELQWDAQTPATGEERYWVQAGASPSELVDIGFRLPIGQPGEISRYTYALNRPTELTYYRVVEEDLSGARRFSRVLSYTPPDARPHVLVKTAQGQLMLSCEEALPVQVLTVTGRRIFDGQLDARLQLNGLSAGVYVLKTPYSAQRIAVQ